MPVHAADLGSGPRPFLCLFLAQALARSREGRLQAPPDHGIVVRSDDGGLCRLYIRESDVHKGDPTIGCSGLAPSLGRCTVLGMWSTPGAGLACACSVCAGSRTGTLQGTGLFCQAQPVQWAGC